MLKPTSFLISPLFLADFWSAVLEPIVTSFVQSHTRPSPHSLISAMRTRIVTPGTTWEFTQEATEEMCTLGCSDPTLLTIRAG